MASTIRQRLRRFNGTDYDTIHLETDVADVVNGGVSIAGMWYNMDLERFSVSRTLTVASWYCFGTLQCAYFAGGMFIVIVNQHYKFGIRGRHHTYWQYGSQYWDILDSE